MFIMNVSSGLNQALLYLQNLWKSCNWELHDKRLEGHLKINVQTSSEVKSYIKKNLKSLLGEQISSKELSFVATQDDTSQYDVALTIINPQLIKKLAWRQHIETLKLSVLENPWQAAKIIKDNDINDQQSLLMLAKMCILADKRAFFSQINNFGIKSQNDLEEVIWLGLKTNSEDILSSIKTFGITDQTLLKTIAEVAIKGNVGAFTRHVDKFGFTSQEVLIDLAMRCTEIEGNALSMRGNQGEQTTLKNIALFGIQDPAARAKIAMCGAQYKNNLVPIYISNFDIEDEDIRIEIAKVCAVNAEVTARHIYNFAITKQEALGDIIIIYAQYRASIVARMFYGKSNEFNITDQIVLGKIAKNLLMSGGWSSIKDFGIESEDVLIECARIFAKKSPIKAAREIKDFGISNVVALREIAALCMFEGGLAILGIEHMRSFPDKVNAAIARLAEIRRMPGVHTMLLCPLLRRYLSEEFPHPLLLDQLQAMEELKDRDGIADLADNLFRIRMGFNDQQIENMCKEKIFEAAYTFGRTDLREILVRLTMIYKKDPLYEAVWQTLPAGKGDYPWQRLARILLAQLSLQGVDKATIDRVIEKTEKGKTEFYNGIHSQTFIELLLALVNERGFKVVDKQMLLERIFDEALLPATQKALKRTKREGHEAQLKLDKAQTENKNVPAKKLRAWNEKIAAGKRAEDPNQPLASPTMVELNFEYIANMKAILGLIHFTPVHEIATSSDSLLLTLERSFRQAVPIGNVIDFSKRFEAVFQSSRNPTAIMTYAGKIKSLHDREATSALGSFVTGALNGTFKEQRYALDNNLHLTTINNKCPEILAAWQESILSFKVVMEDDSDLSFQGEQVVTWLRNKIITDKHLDLDAFKLTYLKEYLEGSSDQRVQFFDQLKLHIKSEEIALQQNKEMELKSSLQKLRLQELCLFCLESDLTRQKSNLNQLTRFLKSENLLDLDVIPSKDLSFEELNDWMQELVNKLKLNMPELPFLQSALQNENLDLSLLRTQLSAARTRAKQAQKLKSSEEQESIICRKMQEYALQLVEETEPEQQKGILLHISALLKTAPFHQADGTMPEFHHDVQGMLSSLQQQVKAREANNFIVVDSDDPIDLLLCGTEVLGSCQRVDGSPQQNKGLLGYMLDGKNRLLAVKDGDKIVARCIARLLWDGEKAVLFRERIYPDVVPPHLVKALNQMAMKKAQALNIPFVAQDGLGERYEKELKALGGPSPWEYCDGAAVGVSANGVYTIKSSRYFFPKDEGQKS